MPTPRAPRGQSSRRRNFLAGLFAILIALYGGLLRFEAVQGRYRRLDQPGWMRTLAEYAVPFARPLRPAAVDWTPVDSPYAGADPINYLRYAREMKHFYQAHVREPVFLALTRAWLWMLDNRDIAVSFASATGSTLAIVATCLLGAAAVSKWVGVAAGGALAIELEAISRSVDGWRDDTFMFFVALAAWAFVRLQTNASPWAAVAAGAASAGACLTRISALSFVLPALVWIVVDSPAPNRPIAARQAGIAFAVCALLVGPYLVNCARATGDPFFAINYHTRYYRAADGLPPDHSVSALEYVGDKIAAQPILGLDTAVTGLVVWPFDSKWAGFALWWEKLDDVLRWCAAAGLVLAFWFRAGRLLLLILCTALAPYALTWSSGGGGDWRFSQHAYPFYLVAACSAIYALVLAMRRLASSDVNWRRPLSKRLAIQAAVAAIVLGVSTIGYAVLPFLVARETLLSGAAINIVAGERDAWFFSGNWSDPIREGVPVRIAQSTVVSMRVPFPEERDYAITVRMDPPETPETIQPRVTVFVNRQPLADVRLDRDPQRMGTYTMTLPRDLAGDDTSRLEFVASHTVAAADAGEPFSRLAPDTPVGFRLWYVRIEPIEPPDCRLSTAGCHLSPTD